MILNEILSDIKNTYILNESGIRIPKGTKAAKILYHRDMDGIFSAIITYNQLVKQGINPKHIYLSSIQYGEDSQIRKKLKTSKGQMASVVDFARLPDNAKRPDFWSDHHENDSDEKGKGGGRIGATEYKSDAEHLATLHTTNMVDGETIKAISIIDSAGFTNLKDVLALPKDFKSKNRIERLAIISNAILTSSGLLSNDNLLQKFIKSTKPSIVSFYNNILKYARLNKIQKEAIKELGKENPNWEMIEKSRKIMPTKETKSDIQGSSVKRKRKSLKEDILFNISEGALEDYEELEKLKKKGNKRTPEEEKRYKELVNEPLDKTRANRREDYIKATKGSDFKSVGPAAIQSNSRYQRYIWTQLRQAGLQHPFNIKRYPTFMQVSINPELPKEVKEKIDLNAMNQNILSKIRKQFGHKYNNWAFDIIEKDSGGHKGITNISGLGTLGIMRKADREEWKFLKSLEDRIKRLKTVGKGKLSDEDKEKLKKAKEDLSSQSVKANIRKEAERLEKILMPTLEKLMPEKAERLKKLTEKKEDFAKERKKIMNDIEKSFIDEFYKLLPDLELNKNKWKQ